MTGGLLSLVALLEKVLAEVYLLVSFIIVVLGEEGGEALLEQGVHAHAPSAEGQGVLLPGGEELLEVGLVEKTGGDPLLLVPSK